MKNKKVQILENLRENLQMHLDRQTETERERETKRDRDCNLHVRDDREWTDLCTFLFYNHQIGKE